SGSDGRFDQREAILVSDAAGLMWRDALTQLPDQQQAAFVSRFYRYMSDEEMSGHEVPTMVADLEAMRVWATDRVP
mgnify:CR=1